MAILNSNNPGDVELQQAPEPLPTPILPNNYNSPAASSGLTGAPSVPAANPNDPVVQQFQTAQAAQQAVLAQNGQLANNNAPTPDAAAPPPQTPAPQPPVATAAQPSYVQVDPSKYPPDPVSASPSAAASQRFTEVDPKDYPPDPSTWEYAKMMGQTLVQHTGDAVANVIKGNSTDPYSDPGPWKMYSQDATDPVTGDVRGQITNPATGDSVSVSPVLTNPATGNPTNLPGGTPSPDQTAADKIASGPFLRGDIKNTVLGYGVRTAATLGDMVPMVEHALAGSLAGGGAGAEIGAAGGPIGAAGGATIGSMIGAYRAVAAQTLVPAYQQAIHDGLSHDAAIDRASTKGMIDGGLNALMLLFPGVAPFGKAFVAGGVDAAGNLLAVKVFRKPMATFIAQSLGMTAVSTGQQIADAKIQNQDITGGDLLSGAANNLALIGGMHMVGAAGRAAFPDTRPDFSPLNEAPASGAGGPEPASGTESGFKFRTDPPVYDADVVGTPPKLPPPGGGGATVDVPVNRDDLANAIKNGTPLPTKKTITLPDVHIHPELQAQGYTVGNKVEQTTGDGEYHEGTVVSAMKTEDGHSVQTIDSTGNLRTLFSTDGPIKAAAVPPAVSQPPAAPVAPQQPQVTNGTPPIVPPSSVAPPAQTVTPR